MAKISELNEEQLINYINSYEKKVQKNPSDFDSQRTLTSLKNRLESLSGQPKIGPKKGKVLKKAASSVVKHHDSNVDYSSFEKATFSTRALAIFIDGVLIGITSNIVQEILSVIFSVKTNKENTISFLLVLILINWIIIPSAYYIVFLRKNGQTIGKILMKIRVINLDNSEQLGVSQIIQREFLGKFISTIFFFIGYIVFLFGKETWHDRIADTKVISIK